MSKQRKILLLAGATILVVGVLVSLSNYTGAQIDRPYIGPMAQIRDIVCPQDAKVCPDGSYVGRVPPTCEFAPCPGVTPTPRITPIPAPPPLPQWKTEAVRVIMEILRLFQKLMLIIINAPSAPSETPRIIPVPSPRLMPTPTPVDTTPLTVIYPNGGEVLKVGQTYNITWKMGKYYEDRYPGWRFSVAIYNAAQDWATTALGTTDISSRSFSWTCCAAYPLTGGYKARITLFDPNRGPNDPIIMGPQDDSDGMFSMGY